VWRHHFLRSRLSSAAVVSCLRASAFLVGKYERRKSSLNASKDSSSYFSSKVSSSSLTIHILPIDCVRNTLALQSIEMIVSAIVSYVIYTSFGIRDAERCETSQTDLTNYEWRHVVLLLGIFRRAPPPFATRAWTCMCDPNISTILQLKLAWSENLDYRTTCISSESLSVKVVRQHWRHVMNGILYRKDTRTQLVLPRCVRQAIMEKMHADPVALFPFGQRWVVLDSYSLSATLRLFTEQRLQDLRRSPPVTHPRTYCAQRCLNFQTGEQRTNR
jgi:hypothetical protein